MFVLYQSIEIIIIFCHIFARITFTEWLLLLHRMKHDFFSLVLWHKNRNLWREGHAAGVRARPCVQLGLPCGRCHYTNPRDWLSGRLSVQHKYTQCLNNRQMHNASITDKCTMSTVRANTTRIGSASRLTSIIPNSSYLELLDEFPSL